MVHSREEIKAQNKDRFAFSVENLTNASIIINALDEKLVIDPWFNDGIYEGTWHNFPRLSDSEKQTALEDVDICMYTHLHKDHFCIETAKKFFKPSTKFLIPKVWGWQVIQTLLNKNGFPRTHVLECAKDVFETNNFHIMTVPPLNVTGLEAQAENKMSIDSGFSLVQKKTNIKCVFLADDNMYSDIRIAENIEVLKNPDLIAFAYSGFASDYPFNFDFTDEEKIQICNEQENKRFKIQINNLKVIKPKCIMPYSSEFVAVGQHSKKWRQILGEIWTSNKNNVANRYASELGVDGIALYPNDYIWYDVNGKRYDNIKPYTNDGPYSLQSLLSYADQVTYKTDPTSSKNADLDLTIKLLKDKLKKAASNYKRAIEKHEMSPLQHLIINVEKRDLTIIDCEGNLKDTLAENDSKPFLKLDIECDLLEKLLDGKLHWDDACLSLKLLWSRSPNLFCSDTLNALNYLKV